MGKKKKEVKSSSTKKPLLEQDFRELFYKHLLSKKLGEKLETAIEKLDSEIEPLRQQLPNKSNTFNYACCTFVSLCQTKQLDVEYALELFGKYFYNRIEDKLTKVSIAMFLCEILPYPEKKLIFADMANEYLKIADNNEPILLLGETGTGKELYAKMFHYLSDRRNKPFVPVNSGALNEETLLSELFGYERGAFTGALNNKKGAVEEADGGTFFLDEIGDMQPKTQVALLRFLNDGKFQKLGKTGINISADVRIIAATNKDIKKEIEGENFREDLFYRFNVFPFRLPPLRDYSRKAKEIRIAYKMLPISLKMKCAKKAIVFINNTSLWIRQLHELISPNALEFLLNYGYPGNYRELENILKFSCRMCDGKIEVKHLPEYVLNFSVQEKPETPSDSWLNLPYREFTDKFNSLHKQKIESALKEVNINVSAAARKLVIPGYKLRNIIKDLGINIKNLKSQKT